MSGRRIIKGLDEALAHAKGERSSSRSRTIRVPEQVDVKAIRERMNMSQREFALLFGFSLANIRNWEQGRRFPDGSARVLLKVIDRYPEEVENALTPSDNLAMCN
ncbi:helix-turn-helix domain-containing protein [Hyphococcus lacteus]|uniref:Type II toxin-antitoxin system MqsA family antitoxin n=1 Tax=Hyphococcus lacteus TaxID=3143536 RepID=A0ABV3Z2R4_9PROT